MWPFSYFTRIMAAIGALKSWQDLRFNSIDHDLRQLKSAVAILQADRRIDAADFRASFRFLVFRATEVGTPEVFVTGETAMGLKFKIGLPAKTAPDVVSGELTVVIAGGEPIVIGTLPESTEVIDDRFVGKDNDTVDGSFKFVDDAGNSSIPTTFSAVLKDTIAPGQPGELQLVVTEEIADPEVPAGGSSDGGSSEGGAEGGATEGGAVEGGSSEGSGG